MGVENVPEAGYESKEEEKEEIEDEENDRDDSKPMAIVRQLMEQDRHDSSAHVNNEPSAPNRHPFNQELMYSGLR